MKLIKKKYLNEQEKIRITEIWNNEYPVTLLFSDPLEFDHYLHSLTDANHYVLENDENELQAWGCTFIRDHEKWFVIILDEKIHRKGKGTEILNAIKKNETNLNGWITDKEIYRKLNGELYTSPLNFYLKNSFILCPGIRMENEKLSAVKITWSN